MNRGLASWVACATAAAAWTAPLCAADKAPHPKLAVEPISARSLLAPAEPDWKLSLTPSEELDRPQSYRIGELPDATGARAKLSVEVGATTLFAIAGRLRRSEAPGRREPFDLRQKSSGKVYGAGIERRVGAVELGATYQYSKAVTDRQETDTGLRFDNPRSHSVRATARIRFGR
jgi:hypothetical protein